AGDVRELVDVGGQLGGDRLGGDADALEQRRGRAVLLRHEREREVLGRDLRIRGGAGALERLPDGVLGLEGETVEVHTSDNLLYECINVKFRFDVIRIVSNPGNCMQESGTRSLSDALALVQADERAPDERAPMETALPGRALVRPAGCPRSDRGRRT